MSGGLPVDHGRRTGPQAPSQVCRVQCGRSVASPLTEPNLLHSGHPIPCLPVSCTPVPFLPKTPDLINSHLDSLVLFSAFSSSFRFALVYLYALIDAHGSHVLRTIQLILVALGRLVHPFFTCGRSLKCQTSSVALKPPPSIRLWLYKRLVSRTESSCLTDSRPSHTKWHLSQFSRNTQAGIIFTSTSPTRPYRSDHRWHPVCVRLPSLATHRPPWSHTAD